MNWIEKYVGLPFVDGGRDWAGVDCWGLVRLVLKTECQIEVPSYGEISAEELSAVAHEVASECAKEPWHPVADRIMMFDVAVMHRRKSPVHVGIMTDQDHVLHIERLTHSVYLPVTHPSISFRNVNYYRHRSLIGA